jgi:hypothetical protein
MPDSLNDVIARTVEYKQETARFELVMQVLNACMDVKHGRRDKDAEPPEFTAMFDRIERWVKFHKHLRQLWEKGRTLDLTNANPLRVGYWAAVDELFRHYMAIIPGVSNDDERT